MLFLFYFSSCNCVMYRAATVNRNIGYPRFRTHGSVSVRLFQISVQVVFLNYFFVKTDILSGKSYKIKPCHNHSSIIIQRTRKYGTLL